MNMFIGVFWVDFMLTFSLSIWHIEELWVWSQKLTIKNTYTHKHNIKDKATEEESKDNNKVDFLIACKICFEEL